MQAIARAHELRRHAQAPVAAAHCALEDVRHAESPAELLRIDTAIAKAECGGAPCHAQAGNSREELRISSVSPSQKGWLSLAVLRSEKGSTATAILRCGATVAFRRDTNQAAATAMTIAAARLARSSKRHVWRGAADDVGGDELPSSRVITGAISRYPLRETVAM